MLSSHAAFLRPVAQPPHDPKRLVIDARAGWREATLDRIAVGAAEGDCPAASTGLRLARAQAAISPLNGPDGSFGGLTLPSHVARAPDGGILLLDRASGALSRFDGCECRFLAIPHTGGKGPGARQFGDPRGMAVCGDMLLVADADKRLVSAFGLLGYTLRGLWAPPAHATSQPWQPVAIAAARGRIVVADRDNGALHFFDGGGRWLGLVDGFGTLCALAIDRRGEILTASEESESVRIVRWPDGVILSTTDNRARLAAAMGRPPLTSLRGGILDLSDQCRDPRYTGLFDLRGEELRTAPEAGDLLARNGRYISIPLDSAIERCQWDRVMLELDLPPGARVRVACHTAEVAKPADEIASLSEREWTFCPTLTALDKAGTWDALIRAQTGRYLWLAIELEGDGRTGPEIARIEVDFPRVSLRRYLPAVYGEEPLSAEFTDRFLAVFDRGLRDIERHVDRGAELFDPASAPAGPGRKNFLAWLGSWIGVVPDASLPLARQREIIASAGELMPLRGTRKGMKRRLEVTFGLAPKLPARARASCAPCRSKAPPDWTPPALVLEHFHLRRWLFLGTGRLSNDAVLWGERIVNRSRLERPQGHDGSGAQLGVTRLDTVRDPWRDPFHVHAHRFSVFLPGWIRRVPGRRRTAARILREEAPAHTAGQIEWVEPRFRVGVQAMIGFDAVIGCYPQGVTLGEARLGRASVLSGADGRHGSRQRDGVRIGSSSL